MSDQARAFTGYHPRGKTLASGHARSKAGKALACAGMFPVLLLNLFALLLVLSPLLIFWGVQIASVIGLDDASYKGKHDKWMWFIVTLMGPLGALLYWLNKPSAVNLHRSVEDDDEDDLSIEELKSVRAAK